MRRSFFSLGFSLFLFLTPPSFASTDLNYRVRARIPESILGEKRFSGNIYLIWTRVNSQGEVAPTPREQMLAPIYFQFLFRSKSVEKIYAEQEVIFQDSDLDPAYPATATERAGFISEAPCLRYQMVAHNPEETFIPGNSAGDLYSAIKTICRTENRELPIVEEVISIDQQLPPYVLPPNDSAKVLTLESKVLSDFHGKRTSTTAMYGRLFSEQIDPNKIYPIVYYVPGFYGTAHDGLNTTIKKLIKITDLDNDARDHAIGNAIFVSIDPNWKFGHTYFTNSPTNGPWRDAFFDEFIPQIEKAIFPDGTKVRRYLTGVSSGGWTALALGIARPEFFESVWIHSPDPVDFQFFQRASLYQANNLFFDQAGEFVPFMRAGKGDVKELSFKQFSDYEQVLGDGGQIKAWEAVFGPSAENAPAALFDRVSGKIDRKVQLDWQAQDLNLILRRDHETLTKKLRGRIHVLVHAQDEFYLNEAVERGLKKTNKNFDYGMEIMISRKKCEFFCHADLDIGHAKMYKKIFQDFHENL